jgi:hypothetical protein
VPYLLPRSSKATAPPSSKSIAATRISFWKSIPTQRKVSPRAFGAPCVPLGDEGGINDLQSINERCKLELAGQRQGLFRPEERPLLVDVGSNQHDRFGIRTCLGAMLCSSQTCHLVERAGMVLLDSGTTNKLGYDLRPSTPGGQGE